MVSGLIGMRMARRGQMGDIKTVIMMVNGPNGMTTVKRNQKAIMIMMIMMIIALKMASGPIGMRMA